MNDSFKRNIDHLYRATKFYQSNSFYVSETLCEWLMVLLFEYFLLNTEMFTSNEETKPWINHKSTLI